MKSRHYRWMITALAALMAGGLVGGCDDDAGWEHPNRELYAAPPEQESDTMSVEELQRAWREQDQRAARIDRGQQTASLADSPDGQAPPDDALGLAIEYLREALGSVMSNTDVGSTDQDPQQQQKRQDALGGGPLPGESPPADNGTGEM